MEERKEYPISFTITDASIDDEMSEYIDKIIVAWGWTKEQVISNLFQFGCKWHLKDQLKFVVEYQLSNKE